jgi:hypothetical protein
MRKLKKRANIREKQMQKQKQKDEQERLDKKISIENS